MGLIYSSDTSIELPCDVISWREKFNFHPKGNFVRRNCSHEELQPLIKQVVIHWAVNYNAEEMFNGLNARGLSCNFMIDDDCKDGFASVYQNLDMMHSGWSQGPGLNNLGIGIEMAYMPNLWEKDFYTPELQRKHNVPDHPRSTATVHGTKLRVFLPTQAQLNSLYALLHGILTLFPNIPPTFPREEGKLVYTQLKKPQEYSGLANHYHLRRDKLDAAGVDMIEIENYIANQRSLWPKSKFLVDRTL